ncbi:MAG: chemotaxis protein CheA [Verrucomicrobiota bacterium]
MNTQCIGQLKGIVQKLAVELAFAEPGKDNALLPVNCLLGQVEQMLAGSAAPGPLGRAVACARRWVDGVFETTGTFSVLVLRQLGDWTGWVQNAAQALETQQVLPPIPPEWEQAASAAPSAPAAPAAAASGHPAAPAPAQEPALVLNIAQDSELLSEFINESQEHLQNIEQGVLVLEDHPTDADTLNTIFRAFHTFKGGSGFLNLTAIQILAHELESLLDQARQYKLTLTPPVINLILEGGDTLKQFVVKMAAQLSGQNPGATIVVPTLQLLVRIRAVLDGGRAPAASTPPPAAATSSSVAASSPPPAAPTGVSAVNSPPATTMSSPGKAAALAASSDATTGSKAATTATVVKVDTSKLDGLVDLVGELVIAQSLVMQNSALTRVEDQQLTRDLAQLGRITKELQRTSMSLRMVPVYATFQKMNRLVRDTAARIGKKVELVMEGEETELDRTIVEEIGDPLMHMVRNAIDHGIEKPNIRQQRGKPPQGTIWLRAFYQGGNIVIEIKDDGNGLDQERILAKAVEKGIVRPDASLSESEIFSLIFAPGFSTAEQVTDLSGRGVGMDVVRRNIDKLRGKVEIQSTPSQGSTFSIYLPLTLAIIDGLIVGVGEQRYIVPTLSVCESFRPSAGMISTVQGRGEMISVRGRLRPVLRLYEHLGVTPASTDPAHSIAVVVEAGKEARCVLVDQLLGKQEVVIKSLGETFKQNRALAGAAILGDGRVGLILDPQALVELKPHARAQAA